MSEDCNKKNNLSQLRQIWPLVVPYKKHIYLALTFLLLGAAANLSIPVTFKMMIDLGFSEQYQHEISKYFLIVLSVSVLMVVFTSFRFYWVSWIGLRVVTDLRKKVYQKVLCQSADFFETTKTGEILSRINTDTTVVETVVGSTFSTSLISFVTLIGACIMLFITSPKLAMMIGLMLPLIIIPITLTGRKIQKLFKIEQDKLADSSALATETINAIAVVQSYAQEQKENQKYQKSITDAFVASINSTRMVTIMSLMIGLVVFCGIVFVLWLGARDVIDGNMTAGTLSQFLMYAVMAATTTDALTNVWGELKKAAGALERITELMKSLPTIQNIEQPIPMNVPVEGKLEFNNVTFSYPSRPDKRILKDFSLRVKAGESVALVGPSGAGKSTVFQLLMRFYEPQKGQILFDGVEVNKLDYKKLRAAFSLVAQNVTIFSTTAFDNISYGVNKNQISQQTVLNSAKIAHANEFISSLDQGYETYLGERGVRLSGGQAQRLSIARAIATDPKVLLLDEATSALDAENESLVRDALNQMMKDKTTIVIAHRLATVRQANRILVMDEGEIIAEGNHQQLLQSNPLYAKLAKLQFSES